MAKTQLAMFGDDEEIKPEPRPTKRCPPDFQITPDLRTWATHKAPDVNIEDETEALKDHEFKMPHKDWPAVWRNWMREQQKREARFKPRNQKVAHPERRYQSADELENAIIERAIRTGMDDAQIVAIEDLAIAPNLRARITAKRRELQPTEH